MKLWKNFSGSGGNSEPYMINPRRVNPRRKRKSSRRIRRNSWFNGHKGHVKAGKKGWRTFLRRRRKSSKKGGVSKMRRRYRKNFAGVNPVLRINKRFIRRKKSTSRSHRRTRRNFGGELMLLNPRMLNKVLGVNIMGSVKTGAGVLVGLIGSEMLPQYVLPLNLRTGTMKYVSQLGTGVVLSMIVGKFLKKHALAENIMIGAVVKVGYDLAKQYKLLSGVGALMPAPPLRGRYSDRELSGAVSQNEPEYADTLAGMSVDAGLGYVK